MEAVLFYLYFLGGITWAFAAVNLIIAMQKGSEKTYLLLGIMGVCVGIYYFLFPYAQVLEPLSHISKIALFFFLSSFGLLPWFFCYYTGYCRKYVQWLLSGGMLVSYVMLLFTKDFDSPILWNLTAHIVLLGIIIFGFISARFQYRRGEKRSAILLATALFLLSLLGIDDIVMVHWEGVKLFDFPDNVLPLDYFLVFFMIIMGLKLARDMQHKYRLEKTINAQESRWSALLENVNLLVVGVERDGTVFYINPFYLDITGFAKNDVVGQHYMKLIPDDQKEVLTEMTGKLKSPADFPYYENTILTRDGEEKIIGWSLVGLYSENGEFVNSISIGADITQRRKAFEEIEALKAKLEMENVILKAELGHMHTEGKIRGESDAIKYVLHRAKQVAETDTTVLLEGETGVGKELVANYIQSNSKRADLPFVKINCSALSASLLESELFGHVRGAFTGADRSKKGLVEMADGGTLFLDEIGEFPLELQPKLLRFLQEGEFMAVGGESQKRVDIRIIAATNRELLKEIENKNFREDLYYRINVYPITIPPLRNRKEDIPEFIDLFVQKFAKEHGKTVAKISKTVMDQMMDYHWPGNIRELENVIERAIIICDSDTLKLKDVPLQLKGSKDTNSKFGKITTLENAERDHIMKALKASDWKIHGHGGAAEILGINPNTLRSRMKKLNISKPS